MLNNSLIPKSFWADAINIACYVMNRSLIRPILKKTPYELYFGRKPNISNLHIFGCKCFVHNNGKDNLGKFDAKSDEAIFLGYSSTSKAFWVYNKRNLQVEKSIHVVFYESPSSIHKKDENEKEDSLLLPRNFGSQQAKDDEINAIKARKKNEDQVQHNDAKANQQERPQKA